MRFNFANEGRNRDGCVLVCTWISQKRDAIELSTSKYNINGRMSAMLVLGKTVPSPGMECLTTLMTLKIPGITWDVGQFLNLFIMYYVRGFARAMMALRARNASPSGRGTLNPLSTRHGPPPGPELAYWVRAGSLCATEPRARGKTRGRKRK